MAQRVTYAVYSTTYLTVSILSDSRMGVNELVAIRQLLIGNYRHHITHICSKPFGYFMLFIILLVHRNQLLLAGALSTLEVKHRKHI